MNYGRTSCMYAAVIHDTPILRNTPTTHHLYAAHCQSFRYTLVCRDTLFENLWAKVSTTSVFAKHVYQNLVSY